MKNKKIPFNTAREIGDELKYIKNSIKNSHISSNGVFTNKCNVFFEEFFSLRKSFLTTSCTSALETVALLLNLEPGDEVIIPSYTFVSTVNPFILNGANPIFIDIRDDTLNMDEKLLESHITNKTKAIIPVHYAGVACEMDEINKIAKDNNIIVIEDNAHGLFGKYKGKYLGTFGTFSTQSFHETKNFTCGEGGALFINDKKYIDRAEIILDKGTNRKEFLSGLVDKYSWVDHGSSYRLADLLAAFLYGQIRSHKEIQSKRKKIFNYYFKNLTDWAINNGVSLPTIPKHCESSYHIFYIIMPDKRSRDNLIDWLNKRDINAVFHYIPLHNSRMSLMNKWNTSECPTSIRISDTIIRLPLYHSLEKKDLNYIIEKIMEYSVI
jgi:dTDP-4-amino-4,6-dideoxygalactose transaminase